MINFVTYNRKVYPTSESIWEFLILWVVEIFYCSSFDTNTHLLLFLWAWRFNIHLLICQAVQSAKH